MSRGKWILRALGHPKLFVPIVLSVSLIVFVLSIADLGRIREGLAALSLYEVATVFLLVLIYLGLKGWQLHLFLRSLEVPLQLRPFLASFAVGEMANTLPAGVYAQNWLLQRLQGARFATTAAATTAALMFEGAVTLTTLLIVGIPGWGWLRPAILAVFGVSLVWVSVLLGSRRARRRGKRFVEHGRRTHKAGEGLVAMLRGIRALLRPRPLVFGGLLSVAYLFTIAFAFFVIGEAVDIPRFRFVEALTVYFFGLAVTLLLGPISTQLGVIEVTSLGALLAWGYGPAEALVLLLVFRLLWLGGIWVALGLLILALHREFRRSSGGDQRKEAAH